MLKCMGGLNGVLGTIKNHHTLAIVTTGSGKTTTVCNIIECAKQNKMVVFYQIKGRSMLCPF